MRLSFGIYKAFYNCRVTNPSNPGVVLDPVVVKDSGPSFLQVVAGEIQVLQGSVLPEHGGQVLAAREVQPVR